ncbi:uncharacterized protein TrAtP1_005970 [Trichoderma atroviride]|uniref:uncharacterized protein n=1 Tax=Hypocrea atroviridis TaxID=63577 RepID=UPI003319F6E4|nr:hypothetical protein TrAtP1_005970 [Trichoderma atroviride]
MPIPSLKGIYQQYKADTDLVAEWLAVTAKTHGYAATATPSTTNPPAAVGGRLKGKARKMAKNQASNQPKKPTTTTSEASAGVDGSGTASKKPTYLIKIKEFEPLAQFVSKVNDVKIPKYFSIALERVIQVRKSFSDRLTSSGVELNAASNDRHSFFVGVLEKVRHHLKPLMGAVSFSVDAKADARSRGLDDNFFSPLEVYYTSAEFENSPDAAIPAPSTDVKYVAEQGDSALDILFAYIALLDDYRRLRSEIKTLWADYASGKLDLAAVSVATNMAFELARNIEEEVDPLFSKLDGGAYVANLYFARICSAFGIDIHEDKQRGDPYNLKAYDLADVCMMNPMTMLISYLQSTQRDEMHLQSYNGSFGWYDEKLGGSGTTNRQKWKQDMTAMLEILPDVSFLAWKLGASSIVDELTRGMAYMMNEPNKTAPLWLCWAFQIYLDILQSLGPDCDRGYRELQQESLKIKHSMLEIPVSNKERSRVLSAATRWDKDPIWAARKLVSDAGLFPNEIAPEFKFLRRNPLHCGLLIHNMRSALHSSGGPYLAGPGALVGVTQLYHALRQEKMLADSLVWEDLEDLWKMQGNPSFFVGDLPTNREAYFKNYCLSIGTSVTNWAAEKRKGKLKINAANRRNLKFMGYLTLATNHRLEHPGERVPWSSAAVENALNEGILKQYTDSRDHIQPEFKDKVEEARVENARLLPPGLIRKLAQGLQAELPGIRFNLFTMHHEAWRFLERLSEGYAGILGAGVLSNKPDELPFAAGLPLAVAAGQMSPQGDKKTEPSDALLVLAAGVLRKFLQEGQGRAVKEAMTKTLQQRDVEGLKYVSKDPWGVEKLSQLSLY